MPMRVPTQRIILTRDGKRVIPTIGKPFDFTQGEIEQIESVNPRAIRKLIIESTMIASPKTDDTAKAKAPAKSAAKPKAADKQGGSDSDEL